MGKWMMTAVMLASSALTAPAALAQSENIVVNGAVGRAETAVFGKRPAMQAPRISPDGTKIVFKHSKDGVDRVAWLDLTKPGSPPNFFIESKEVRDEGDRTVQSWRWLGDNIILLNMISLERVGDEKGGLGRIVSYDLETKKLQPLAWDGSGINASILYTDHKTEKLYIQRDTYKDGDYRGNPEVIDVNPRTGKFTIVQRPNVEVGSWDVDGNGVIRAGTGFDGKSGKQRLMYRSNGKEVLKTVQNLADETFTGVAVYPEVFTNEPDMAYATSNKDGYRKVYKLNVKSMTLDPKPVFQLKGYDVDSVLTNKANDDIAGIAFTTDRERRYWLDPHYAQVQALLEEQFGKGNVLIGSSSEDKTKLTAFVARPDQAGTYYLYDTVSGKLSVLGHFHGILEDREMNPMEAVKYKASDGMEIQAIVTYPRHRKHRTNLPAIVMPHGGPFGVRDNVEFGYFPWHQAMAELGYVVIQPNYRGSGGYGRQFELEGRKPNGYGKRMQDDLNDAATWFAGTGLIDKGRMCIMGWSYGGYATARGAQRDGDLWKCAIAGAGVYDMPLMNTWDAANLSSFRSKFQDTSDDAVGISPARFPEGKWSPILIVAGKLDQRIPLEQSRTLVGKLKGAGKKEGVDFRYIEQEQGTHNLPYEDVHIQWLQEAEAWARRFNPAYIASDPDKEPPVTITVANSAK